MTQRLLWALGIAALLNGNVAPCWGQGNDEAGTRLELQSAQGGQIEGELKPEDGASDRRHYHLFTLTGNTGDQFTFRLQSQDFDPVIKVIDAAGNTQAYDDQADINLDLNSPSYDLPPVDEGNTTGQNEGAEIIVTLPGFGQYRVVVTTFAPQQTGTYTLTWEPTSAETTVSAVFDAPETNRLAWGGYLFVQADELMTAGLYDSALPLAQEALAIAQTSRAVRELGPNTPTLAAHFTQLATIYGKLGRYGEAEAMYFKSLEIWRTFDGGMYRQSISVAQLLSQLGVLYFAQGQFQQAEDYSTQALAIYQQPTGQRERWIPTELNNLAAAYAAQGRYQDAQPLLEESLAVNQVLLQGEHPTLAVMMGNLADVYARQGQLTQAEPLYQEAIAMQQRLYRDQHPEIGRSLHKLARFYWQQNQLAGAIAPLTQALEIEEANLNRLLVIGSERQKQDYFQTVAHSLDAALSFHLQSAPNRPDAARLAFTTLLRRKGRILDAVSDNLRAIQQDLSPETQRLLERLQVTRRQIATLVFDPPSNPSPDYQTEITRLKTEADHLEAQLAQRQQAQADPIPSVAIADVQAQIPDNAALLEFILYRPFDPATTADRWGVPRYAVYILTAEGDLQWVDLGSADLINEKIRTFTRRLKRTTSDGAMLYPTSQDLYQAVMAPILAKLDRPVEHLLISPDGQLNLIPFAALVNDNEQYLIEDYEITYLTSGRDLLRNFEQREQSHAPIILADINYGENGTGASDSAQPGQRRASGLDFTMTALANTAVEGAEIQQLFPDAQLLTQNAATENAVKATKSPEILHIATHGFFLHLPPTMPADLTTQFFTTDELGDRPALSAAENPLLRSGLALAGFNQRQSGTEDGVLTALEVAGLNLYGTKLTVLSACDTGVGEVANGEGVYGLRRALIIAGSESQVMSLWQVDDAGTQALMVAYYQNLKAGLGRSEALRQVQLNFLNSEQYSAPYFWAAFIPSGNWRSLEGK
ncbi:CHAT domain-containing tetratricopeptide repeat protein [Spirulina sp. CCNP1310]|uniref:CHAT domain-containing protein n=1 Tax=Spirulina sp. CCNP1310 TaxID=3110249 RepID=UPI002B1F6962|nr:CHAT domain-containing tetratricopeptide repeat protein [Spirulina sp. CCNP1310]MEA5421139.1 CHAT domain-containing tetratricopeptide repeat protein [Spirulina sp. CCNP1310]